MNVFLKIGFECLNNYCVYTFVVNETVCRVVAINFRQSKIVVNVSLVRIKIVPGDGNGRPCGCVLGYSEVLNIQLVLCRRTIFVFLKVALQLTENWKHTICPLNFVVLKTFHTVKQTAN